MWLPSPIVRFLWGSPVLSQLMQARLERLRKKDSVFQEPELLLRKVEDVSLDGNLVPSLRWAIKLPVPAGEPGMNWGDLYFAQDLAVALNEFGQDVKIDRRNTIIRESTALDDVIMSIRGLERVKAVPGKINILWIIYTPELITRKELKEFDLIFAASATWANTMSRRTGISIKPLLQCTNPFRFNPGVATPDSNPGIVFVGNARNKLRKVIADSKIARISPQIYGKGWDDSVDISWIASEFISNSELPTLYRSSTIILNDHRPDMAKRGFLSNRLFDAVAAGARVVSDDVSGITDVFGRAVQIYKSPRELRDLCSSDHLYLFGDEAEVRERAMRIGVENSFSARARELVLAVSDFISK